MWRSFYASPTSQTAGSGPWSYLSVSEFQSFPKTHADRSQEMVKWFDSNYHYVKPTFQDGQSFTLSSDPKPVREYLEAKEAGIATRPVLLGPVSFLHLGKADRDQTVDPITLLDKLLPVYVEVLEALKKAGAETVQIDEPILVFDLPAKVKEAFKPAYQKLSGANLPNLVLATYFGDIVHNFDVIPSINHLHGLHIDLVRNPEQLDSVLQQLGPKQVLSAVLSTAVTFGRPTSRRRSRLLRLSSRSLERIV